MLLHVVLGINRQKAQEWCIKHGFELVELSPEELPEEDGECWFLQEAGFGLRSKGLFQPRVGGSQQEPRNANVASCLKDFEQPHHHCHSWLDFTITIELWKIHVCA